MGYKKLILIITASILILGSVAGVKAKHSDNQLGPVQYANWEGSYLQIQVNMYGVVFYSLHFTSETPVDTSVLNIPSNSPEVRDLSLIGFDLDTPSQNVIIYVVYKGDVGGQSGYNSTAETIIQSIQNKLGLSVSSSSNIVYYLNGTDTVYAKTYYFTDQDQIVESKVKNFANSLVEDPFHEYITTPNQELTYTNFFITNKSNKGFLLSYFAQFNTENFHFSGNGTHTLSLKTITGLTNMVTGTNFMFLVTLPQEALINASTYEGPLNQDTVFFDNIAFIFIDENDTFTDISFQFTYNFATTGSDGGDTGGDSGGETGGETEQPGNEQQGGTGFSLSSNIVYIIAGVVVLAIVGIVAKSLIKK